ncbi:uncharacterized protein LOC114362400 [Ostrinia furnacalis]|uniref:uncharacterized protein LOC114362400 n=1 Tax=Ostrinia furnacalis TaxID=93504 RepID=UPI00103CC041|nr:uncharacterized protein LOC114362400 [Ostrinia furnacalis]
MKGVVFAFLCLLAVTVQSEKNVESELRRLPKLFHLDDYEACMERDNGIYCLGKFQIYSDMENNPLFDLIQEKAQDIHLFNRSFIHRGYCLTTRCPNAEANVTTRFERCVDTWARTHALRTRLHELHYCKTAGKPLPIEKNTDMPHQLLLYFVYGILALNLIGTVYDVMFRTGEGNFILMAFSFPANWKKFGTMSDESDPRINNLQVLYGIRTWFMCTAIAAHVGLVVCMVYQHNPRFFEKLLASRAGSTLGASTTITQAYIVMSNFLTAFSLISVSAKHKIGLRTIPVLVLKRAIRLYPIYLTVNAFAATWWTNVGQGPMWPLVVGGESAICRKKFWLTTVFLQNIVDPEQVCLVQTWIMAVDMQLQVATMVLVLLLLKRREWAMPVLYAVFAAVTALTTAVAFNKEYLPLFNVVTPE